MNDFEVVPSGTMKAIGDKLDYLYGVNGIDSRAYDVLRGLLPEALTPPNASCGRCNGRGTIGIREICPRCGGTGRVA